MSNFDNLAKNGAYVLFKPLFDEINSRLSKGDLILAIDGGSASGKTTLASLIQETFGGVIFHMDDFFLPPEMRTPERLCEVGGNVHRERFLSEVLIPLSEKKAVEYRKFNCSTGDFGDIVSVAPSRLTIVEGVYSMHDELCSYYGLSVFLESDKETQKNRILNRNPSKAMRFFNEWIPLENVYFEKMNIKNKCDFTFNTK